jgi:hypothetical protein
MDAKFQTIPRETVLNSGVKYISAIKTCDLIVRFGACNQNDESVTERWAALARVEGGGGLLVTVGWEQRIFAEWEPMTVLTNRAVGSSRKFFSSLLS